MEFSIEMKTQRYTLHGNSLLLKVTKNLPHNSPCHGQDLKQASSEAMTLTCYVSGDNTNTAYLWRNDTTTLCFRRQ
jgi:hypothetical protein